MSEKLVWTFVPPTEPGHYWIRECGTIIVEYLDEIDVSRLVRDPQTYTAWAGPIPLPAEPEEGS